MSERYFILDVSDYQPPEKLDYGRLKQAGVEGVIVRASQGSYLTHQSLREHVRRAHAAGMVIGAHHWLDPMVGANENLDRFLRAVEGLPVSILAVEVEQYWQSWAEWRLAVQRKGQIEKIIQPAKINACARKFVLQLRGARVEPLLVRARAGFVKQYAPEMQDWLGEFDLWVTQHGKTHGQIPATWPELKSVYYPKGEPELPVTGAAWRLWNFTANRYQMEFCHGNANGSKRAMSVNIFNGGLDQFEAWITLSEECIK